MIIVRLCLFCLCALVMGCRHNPSSPPKVEFVIEGSSRLAYDCNHFMSQAKTRDDLLSLRARTITTIKELMNEKDRNLVLITSIRSAMETNDLLRVEQLVVTYECGKLLKAK